MAHERALLVTTQFNAHQRTNPLAWPIEDEIAELEELVNASGCKIIGHISAKRHKPVAGTFLGQGKLVEIALQVQELQAQTVIFNQELSPAQQRNIEDVLKAKAIDRTQLILDIFAQRAHSKEGKIQVELAQLRYLLPRLSGKGIVLSRLGGGIGTRGPGEQKLEVDRRRVRQRITRLRVELNKLGKRRKATRERRKEADVPIIALLGYTNAGKTTLLNRCTGAVASVKQQMFTTLDPLARRLRLPSGEWIVMTDTVGFLHHLPKHLVEAFRATFEEARDATALLHMLDASHPLVLEHASSVEAILEQLDLDDKPRITVLNKMDRVKDIGRLKSLAAAYPPSVVISAKTGEGMDSLLNAVGEALGMLLVEPIKLRIPIQQADVIASVYREGQVLKRSDFDTQVEFSARLPAKARRQLERYII